MALLEFKPLEKLSMASDYDHYKGVPFDLRPTRADEAVLSELVQVIKSAFKIRHDFDTALQISDRFNGIIPVLRLSDRFVRSKPLKMRLESQF